MLIGTSRYDELTQVPAAANSLESMYRLLTGPLCGWSAGRVTRIQEPKEPGNLPDRLVELFGQAEDVALFYYVGHGQVDFEDQLCLGLAGSRVQSERRATTSLTFQAVRRALRASPAATKVVILDCCFAGHAVQDRNALAGTDEVDIAGLAGASGAYTLAATGPASKAWFESDADSVLPHTHFTRALVDAVARGIPGAPAVLTLEPVYHRLREVLPASGRPAPTRVSRHNADAFAFARNTAYRPEPPPPPTAVGPAGNPAARRRLLDLAEDAAHTIAEPRTHCHALIGVAAEAARDDTDRTRRLLDESERITGTIKDHDDQAGLWWALARTTAASDPARARGFLAAAEQAITAPDIDELTRNRTIRRWWDPEVLRLDPDRTERLARAITEQSDRGRFIASAAMAVAARDPDRAERLARIVSGDAEHYGEALRAVAYAVRDHDPDRAERIVRAITNVTDKCRGLASVAASVAAYDTERAGQLLGEALRAADRAGDREKVSHCLSGIVHELVSGLQSEDIKSRHPWTDWIQEEVQRITRKIPDEKTAARAAIDAAKAVRGKPEDARRLLKFADRKRRETQASRGYFEANGILEDIAVTMLQVDIEGAVNLATQVETDRDWAITAMVPIIAQSDPGRAETLAQHAAQPEKRAQALAAVAVAMARDNTEAAMTLLDHARRTGRAAGRKAATLIAREVAALDPDLALEILAEGGSPISDKELAEIARVILKNDPERSAEIAQDIADPDTRAHVLTQVAACYAGPARNEKSGNT